jgi:hypothetical protein
MYKLGKLPARPDAVAFKLSAFATLPTPPAKYGHYKLVDKDWGMLGNDMYGDCVLAGAAHETMLWNKEAKKDTPFTTDIVLDAYSAITGFNRADPSTDNGTDMEEAAKFRRKVGMNDLQGQQHKIGAYLALKPGNVTQLKQAVSNFSAVGIGFLFPASAMDQFNNGKPWAYKGDTDILGGHYVPVVGYNKTHLYVVTWGRLHKMSWAFYKKYNDESIAYLSEEMLTDGKSIDGLDLSALQTALGQL